MTEQDLWNYQDALKEVQSFKMKIEEINEVLASPKGCAFSPMDRGTPESPDKLAPVLDILACYESALIEAQIKAGNAMLMLDRAETVLSETEKKYLNVRYRKGVCGWYNLEKATGHSDRQMRRMKKSILKKIEKI